MLEFGHLTHPGLGRDWNEDTYYGDSQLGLWLVADGMGNRPYGATASTVARDTIVGQTQAGQSLTNAIRQADSAIVQASDQAHMTLPMGATVVALRTQQNHYEIAQVGDCRAFLWQDERLRAINDRDRHDHPSGRQTSQSGKRATQALGVTNPANLQITITHGDIQAGMQWLLCSDGLTEQVDDHTIAIVLQKTYCSAQECVDMLVATALQRDGQDNITAMLIRCHSR